MTGNVSREVVAETIVSLLADLNGDIIGISLPEIYRHVKSRLPGVDKATVSESVKLLLDQERLEQRANPRGRDHLYHLPGHGFVQLPMFENVTTRDEVEQEEMRETDLWDENEPARAEEAQSVLMQIAQGQASEDNYAQQVRTIAPQLAGQNPIDLILEAAEWAVDDLNNLAGQLQQAERRGQINEVRRLGRQLGFRRQKIVVFFQRLWRLDAGILNVPSHQRNMLAGERAFVDIAAARQRLQERVFGNNVIDILSIPPNDHRAVAGTDASVGDVNVTRRNGSFIPPIPANLFVAVGAMRVKQSQDHNTPISYWDFDIDPRELERYEDYQAAEEGLLISPLLRREAISDYRHLRSAAMELRQYMEEMRIVTRQANWQPYQGVPELQNTPQIGVLFRDGRIFPLVHRLDDFDGASAPDDELYGKIVRREITLFRDVFHNTVGLGKGGTTYAGVVKAPEFSWLAMLVFWYINVKCSNKNLEGAFYNPPLNDQAVAHLLFWGLTDHQPELTSPNAQKALVTFRAVRRFSDIAFPAHPLIIEDDGEIVDENDEDAWERYIQAHIRDADARHRSHRRGIPSLGSIQEYHPFLDLCRRAAVGMYYAAPSHLYNATVRDGSHFLTPRWELCLDLSQNLDAQLNDRLLRALVWIGDRRGLVRDESHAVGGFEEKTHGLPLFIPDVVLQAHEVVGHVRDRHSRDLEETLLHMVHAVRQMINNNAGAS
jgi:Fe2+ or Zn2+ uptake regulation protein